MEIPRVRNLSAFFLLVLLGCQSSPFQKGLQKPYEFYLPAQIVFTPVMNLKKDKQIELEELILSYDKEILEAVSHQKFVHGYSPQLSLRFLKQKGKQELFKKIKESFQRSLNKNESLAISYQKNLKNKPEWLFLLKEISLATGYSDSLFLPFVTKVNEQQKNERGLQVSQREIEITLLLLEVESASIIWMEKNSLTLSHKKVPEAPAFHYPSYPSWKSFKKKLIVKLLWKNFPGWQY